jgi:succinate dehydrogenase hydrophobic anchor subunit
METTYTKKALSNMPESKVSDFSSLRWFLQRTTAVILLACLVIHVLTLHFTKEPITFQFVINRVQDSLFWGSFYLVFLSTTLFHGLNGTYGVIMDYAPSNIIKNLTLWSFWIIGILSFFWGVRVLILFHSGM